MSVFYEISYPGGLKAVASDYGCIIKSLYIPLSDGTYRDVVLGYDTIDEYKNSETYFGAVVGPVADRISGAELAVAGKKIVLEKNAGNDCMHFGKYGFSKVTWKAKVVENGIEFSKTFADNPLPGNLDVKVRYLLPDEMTFLIEYEAICSEETVLSLTNHSYFSLNGGTKSCAGDELVILSSAYAETDCSDNPLVTGNEMSLDNSPLDFRKPKNVGIALMSLNNPEISSAGGVDHYFIVPGEGMRRHALMLAADKSLGMMISSSAPGVLVYSGNGLHSEKGKNGQMYGKNYGIAFETESFPNAVNIPHMRESVVLKPGQKYMSATEFAFFY